MDRLRTCRIKGYGAPIGTPIRFNGETVGQVVRNEDGHCEIAINSDSAYSILRGNNYSFSMEVVKNG